MRRLLAGASVLVGVHAARLGHVELALAAAEPALLPRERRPDNKARHRPVHRALAALAREVDDRAAHDANADPREDRGAEARHVAHVLKVLGAQAPHRLGDAGHRALPERRRGLRVGARLVLLLEVPGLVRERLGRGRLLSWLFSPPSPQFHGNLRSSHRCGVRRSYGAPAARLLPAPGVTTGFAPARRGRGASSCSPAVMHGATLSAAVRPGKCELSPHVMARTAPSRPDSPPAPLALPITAWESIRSYISPDRALYCKLGRINRAARTVFCSNKVWSQWTFAPDPDKHAAFMRRIADLDPRYQVWMRRMLDGDVAAVEVEPFAPHEFDFALAYTEKTKYIDADLLRDALVDREFVLKMLHTIPDPVEILLRAPFKDDFEVVLAAVKSWGVALEYASPALQDDRDIALAAVSNTGYALSYASARLRADREIVAIAVANRGEAIWNAAHELRGDKSLVSLAVKNWGGAIWYAPSDLKNNREFILAASAIRGEAIHYASREVSSDRRFTLHLIQENPLALRFTQFNKNLDFVLEAIRLNPRAMRFCPEELKELVISQVGPGAIAELTR